MKSENLQYLETMKRLGIFMVAFWAVALFASAQEDSMFLPLMFILNKPRQ